MATINEFLNEQGSQTPLSQRPTPTAVRMTKQAIHDYLSENETLTNGMAWYLHILCRTGEGDNYDYRFGELDNLVWFMDQLLKTFMDPKASKAFCKINDQDPAYLADYLMRMRTFFNDLFHSKIVDAQLDQVEVGHFGTGQTSQELHSTRMQYLRLSETAAAEKAAHERYNRRS